MKITVRRVQRVRDWGGFYQLWIDGERVAWIFSGFSKTLEVEPGEHEMVCMMNKTLTSPRRMRVSHNYIQLRQIK